MSISGALAIKEERSEKINKRIILVEFSNGHLKLLSMKNGLEYTCYTDGTKNFANNPKRILVAKSNRLSYTGTNFENDGSQITSTVLKVCVFNRRNSCIEFYDADLFHMKPLLNPPDITGQSIECRSYSKMSTDLTLAFGSKTKIKGIHSYQRYGINESSALDSVESMLTVTETALEPEIELPIITENSTTTVIPPQNSAAVSVDEVYNLFDIISEEVYAALDSEMETFLSVKNEDIQQWKEENKYSNFIILYIQNNVTFLDQHKAKLLCYLHYMICFLKTGYADWRKKDPVPSVPQPFKKALMDSFTINKALPQRMKDKLFAYAVVLGLILNNYVVNGTILASSAKISSKKMESIAHALGCHVSGNKNNETTIIELKLPLYKFHAGPKRKRIKM